MILALIKKELLALSRDLHGLAALFILPMVFIIVMSMALKDVYSPSVKKLSYGVVNQDGGKRAQRLVKLWEAERGEAVASLPDWQAEVRTGRLKYVLLIEADFTQAVNDAFNGKRTEKVRLITEPGLDNGVFESNRARLIALVAQLRTESMLAKLPNAKLDASALLDNTMVEVERAVAGAKPTAVQQNVPAWLVFGMFFVVASIAGLFVDERSCGALSRLRSLGASPAQLILAKILPYMAVNGVQAALMLAVGVWLMPLIGGEGLSLHGIHWPALLLVLLCISAAAVSLALTVASLVSTHGQAATLGPILNVLMAALGGIMVPLFVMPEVMQKIAAYSPMNWGLEGLLAVLLRGAEISSVLPEIARLLGFASLMLLSAYLLFRRR
ncbi:MAG: ABC transporter permease [Polaromonas sp.]